ncbi:MAG: hypothetical protein WC708_13170 [Lentisphaeria bacterium]
MWNHVCRLSVMGVFYTGLCIGACGADTQPLLDGIALRQPVPLTADTEKRGIAIVAHTDLILVLTLPPGSVAKVDDLQGRKMAGNPGRANSLVPLRKGRYTLHLAAGDETGASASVDAVALGRLKPSDTATLVSSHSNPVVLGYFVDLETAGDYGLSFTTKYKGKLPAGGGYNIQREGGSQNVYTGFYPDYTYGTAGDFNTVDIAMSKVFLTPGRYYFVYFYDASPRTKDLGLTIKATFSPQASEDVPVKSESDAKKP